MANDTNQPRTQDLESDRLHEIEATIAEARAAVDRANATIGAALREIRDGRLYRATHKSFGAYCLERWELSRAHAYRLIDQVVVVENLSPKETDSSSIPPPAPTESQARELVGLQPEQQRQVWTAAVDSAPAGKPTALQVRAARARLVRSARSSRRAAAVCWLYWGCFLAAALPGVGV